MVDKAKKPSHATVPLMPIPRVSLTASMAATKVGEWDKATSFGLFRSVQGEGGIGKQGPTCLALPSNY
jgi:hypothetical protein